MGVGGNARENPTPILAFPVKGKGLSLVGILNASLLCGRYRTLGHLNHRVRTVDTTGVYI